MKPLVTLLSVLSLLALSGSAFGQGAMRTRAPAGEVHGLEMTLEGSLSVPRGAVARWLLHVHEVVGLSDLRPAARTRVRLITSMQRDRAGAEIVTGSDGHAELALEIPADAPETFHAIFEAVSPRGVRRQFEADVRVLAGRAVSLDVDRTVTRPGQSVTAWGRVTSTATRRPIANTEVRVQLLHAQGRPAAPSARLRTDAHGGYVYRFTLPARTQSIYPIQVTTGEELDEVSARLIVTARWPETPDLIFSMAAEPALVRPGATVHVRGIVRTGNGRPAAGADVRSSWFPMDPRTRQPRVMLTDARGSVEFDVHIPSSETQGVRDLAIAAMAFRADLGQANGQTMVRLFSQSLFAAVATEGGAMCPGLPGRVYARVVGADGAPAGAGVRVTLEGPALRQVTGVTDADGALALETSLLAHAARRRVARARPAPGGDGTDESGTTPTENTDEDDCGGTTATVYRLTLARDNETATATGCLPIDLDGTVRVRLPGGPIAGSGTDLRVDILRGASVARWPVEVALLERSGEQLVPLAARAVAPGASQVTLPIPAGASGVIVVRARPMQGTLGIPVRGGSTAVWATPGTRVAVRAAANAAGSPATVQLDGDPSALASAAVVVVPVEVGRELEQRLEARATGQVLGDLRVDAARAGVALVAGAMATMTPTDVSVPAVVRAGQIVPLPAPDDAAALGLLRDPWRSRARFVEGRLAILFRQIEGHVASHVRRTREDLAVRDASGRWTFNRELLDALLAEAEQDRSTGARGLGGEPLTIETLQRLDPAFAFDSVARRITRRRLMQMLTQLRSFVTQHGLDLRWSWRGDPTTWLRSMVDETGMDVDETFDGWGTRMALRAAPGGHTRFGFLSPLQGYELVSAGPDLRFGTGDDVVDPFVRVLPSGGAYARAVDEDGLIARMHGVELGRATLEALASTFEVEMGWSGSGEEGGAAAGQVGRWSDLPSEFRTDPYALDLVRPALASGSHVTAGVALHVGEATAVPMAVDDEARTWAVVVDAWNDAGYSASTITWFRAGAPVVLNVPMTDFSPDEGYPVRPVVRLGDRPHLWSSLTNLETSSREYHLRIAGDDHLAAHAPASVRVGPGEAGAVDIELEPRSVGDATLVIEVLDGAGARVRTRSIPLHVDTARIDAREDRMERVLLGQASAEVALGAAGHRSVTRARVVLATPATLADDPELDRVRSVDPAIIAWARVLSSRPVPASLRVRLLEAWYQSAQTLDTQHTTDENSGRLGTLQTGSSMLSTACAVGAWSAAEESDVEAGTARDAAARQLGSRRSSLVGPAGAIREAASVLVALAAIGGVPTDDDASGDPVAPVIQGIRAQLRTADHDNAQWPGAIAQAAAALLLADSDDARGLELFHAARRSLREQGGDAWLPSELGAQSPVEDLAGLSALVIAATQAGDTALAERLARAVGRRAHTSMRLGSQASFWLLAAAGTGALGEGAVSARVRAGGVDRVVSLASAAAVVDLAASERAVRLESAASGVVFARLERSFELAATARHDAPVAIELRGDPGHVGETAAYELDIASTVDRALERVALEIALPSGAVLDAAARGQLRARAGAQGIEMRPDGLLRIVLPSIAARQHVQIPLALTWMAAGALQGVRVVAYLESAPGAWTVLPARPLALRTRGQP